jgi:hypothetical protein
MVQFGGLQLKKSSSLRSSHSHISSAVKEQPNCLIYKRIYAIICYKLVNGGLLFEKRGHFFIQQYYLLGTNFIFVKVNASVHSIFPSFHYL